MKLRSLLLLALLWSLPVSAELEGTQRLVGLVGWRYTPNDTFIASAAANGYQVKRASLGGPQGSVSFGYSFTDWAELAVDLFVGGEQIAFVDVPPLQSITYGGAVGIRLQQEMKLFGQPFIPMLGVFTGPAFIYVSGMRALPPTETLIDSYAASLGATLKVSQAIGVTAEARVIFTRGFVPGIGSINGGGGWFGVGVSWFLGQIPKDQRGTLD